MNSRSIFHYVGIGALIWFLTKSFTGFVASRFSLGNIRMQIRDITSSGLSFTLQIPIQNGSPVSVPIDSFQGVVRYGQYFLADLFITNPVTIKAGETEIYTIDGNATFSNLADSIVQLVSNGDFENNLFLDMKVKSAGIVYDFTQPVKVL